MIIAINAVRVPVAVAVIKADKRASRVANRPAKLDRQLLVVKANRSERPQVHARLAVIKAAETKAAIRAAEIKAASRIVAAADAAVRANRDAAADATIHDVAVTAEGVTVIVDRGATNRFRIRPDRRRISRLRSRLPKRWPKGKSR